MKVKSIVFCLLFLGSTQVFSACKSINKSKLETKVERLNEYSTAWNSDDRESVYLGIQKINQNEHSLNIQFEGKALIKESTAPLQKKVTMKIYEAEPGAALFATIFTLGIPLITEGGKVMDTAFGCSEEVSTTTYGIEEERTFTGNSEWRSFTPSSVDITIIGLKEPLVQSIPVRSDGSATLYFSEYAKKSISNNPISLRIECNTCAVENDKDSERLTKFVTVKVDLAKIRQEMIAEDSARKLQDQKMQAQQKKEEQMRLKLETENRVSQERAKQNLITNGDGSPDDLTCKKYGFKPNTTEYASCRLQIDQARLDAQRQQAQFDEQRRRYEAELEEQKQQRKIASGLALMQLGAGISSGAYNANNSYGALPAPPNPNRTYVLPGGKVMNCTTTGSITNCF